MDPRRIPFKLTRLSNGDPSRWETTLEQERLCLALRRESGSKAYHVGLADGYMFTPINAQRAA